MTFLSWFFETLNKGLCPHCANPITQTNVKGYSVQSVPCGCELYRVTIEPYKVASLDEYRDMKNGYLKLIKEKADLTIPFRAYCIFISRYKSYLKAKLKQKPRKNQEKA